MKNVDGSRGVRDFKCFLQRTRGVRNRKCTHVHDFLYDCIYTYMSCIHFELKQKQNLTFCTIDPLSTTFKS